MDQAKTYPVTVIYYISEEAIGAVERRLRNPDKGGQHYGREHKRSDNLFFPLNQGMPPQLINNISVTAKCCRERHIGLNENTLRFLCRTGQIPCIKVGNKTLINWNVLMEFLMSGGVKAEQPEPEAPVPVAAADGIRKVPARIKR